MEEVTTSLVQLTMAMNQSNQSIEQTRRATNEGLERIERRMAEEKKEKKIR